MNWHRKCYNCFLFTDLLKVFTKHVTHVTACCWEILKGAHIWVQMSCLSLKEDDVMMARVKMHRGNLYCDVWGWVARVTSVSPRLTSATTPRPSPSSTTWRRSRWPLSRARSWPRRYEGPTETPFPLPEVQWGLGQCWCLSGGPSLTVWVSMASASTELRQWKHQAGKSTSHVWWQSASYSPSFTTCCCFVKANATQSKTPWQWFPFQFLQQYQVCSLTWDLRPETWDLRPETWDLSVNRPTQGPWLTMFDNMFPTLLQCDG